MPAEPVLSSPEEWAAFDRLPREVRQLLATSRHTYESGELLAMWVKAKSWGWSRARFAAEVATLLRRADANP